MTDLKIKVTGLAEAQFEEETNHIWRFVRRYDLSRHRGPQWLTIVCFRISIVVFAFDVLVVAVVVVLLYVSGPMDNYHKIRGQSLPGGPRVRLRRCALGEEHHGLAPSLAEAFGRAPRVGHRAEADLKLSERDHRPEALKKEFFKTAAAIGTLPWDLFEGQQYLHDVAANAIPQQ